MSESLVELTKEYLAEPRFRIKLHDLVIEKTIELQSQISEEKFPTHGNYDNEEFINRLSAYDEKTDEFLDMYIMLGYWATEEQKELISLPLKRLSNQIQQSSGVIALLALRWYPLLLITYYAGIAAIAASNYNNLYQLFHTPSESPGNRRSLPLILNMISELGDLENSFKQLPERERQHVPRSEYIYEKLKPKLGRLLFIGYEYETIFDRFEIL